MLRQVILLLTVAGSALAWDGKISRVIDNDQVNGLAKLLGLENGVIATCKLVLFPELVTYDVADKNCRNFNIDSGRGEEGNLATVDNDEKNDDLMTLLTMAYNAPEDHAMWADKNWVWAGLRKTKNNDSTDPGDYSGNDWEWADGSHPESFSKWFKFGEKHGQPDQASLDNGIEGCDEDPTCFQNQMRINHDGIWDDTWKFKTHPYVCDYKGKYIISKEQKTWEEAKAACEGYKLDFAKIRNGGEVGEMKLAMDYFLGEANFKSYWDADNWVWLGGNDLDEEGTWKWSDEAPLDWDEDWMKKAGKGGQAGNDDAKKLQINGRQGQHGLAISRKGQFDDSYHNTQERKLPFACQCPGS